MIRYSLTYHFPIVLQLKQQKMVSVDPKQVVLLLLLELDPRQVLLLLLIVLEQELELDHKVKLTVRMS